MADADAPQHESRAAFARRMGVTAPAVTQWAASGRIVCAADGRVDVAASLKRHAETINSRGGPRKAGVLGDGSSASVPGAAPGARTLTDARIDQTDVKAALQRIELDERRGRLVDRDSVLRGIADGQSPIVGTLRTLSARVAPRLAPHSDADVRRIQEIVDAEIERVCQEIADTLRQMIGGGSRQ